MHATGLWRADIDVLELILGGDLALAQFRDLGANVAELLSHFAADILIDLDDLQLDLGNFAGGFGFRSDQLTALAAEPRSIAFERCHAGEGNKLLFPKLENALQFLFDESDLLRLGLDLLG